MRRKDHPLTFGVSGDVLVVDPDRLSPLVDGLRAHASDYDVMATHDAPSALATAEERRPALVLVCDRGGLDVPGLCTRLRADWRYGNPILFVLTEEPQRSSVLAGVADECLQPTDAATLALRIVAALQRSSAMRDASPLTGLPGNAAITAELQRRMALGDGVALLHADLDNFKAINDAYGFLRGDEVIVALAGVLRAIMAEVEDMYVGHIGGDDFIVLASPQHAKAVGRRILRRFEALVPDFYDPEDLARGGLVLEDRQGVPRGYPLLSLSIGVALSPGNDDHRALVAVAAEMKRQAKRMQGNALAVDRRQASGTPRLAPWPRRLAARLLPRQQAFRQVFAPLRLVAVSAVVAGLALSTVGASTTAKPGDWLYATKLMVEDVRLSMASDATAELSLRMEFTSRRVQELMQLAAEGGSPELLQEAGEALRRHLAALDSQLAHATPADGALKEQYAFTLSQQLSILDTIRAQRCADAEAASHVGACAALDAARSVAEHNLTLVRGEGPTTARRGSSGTGGLRLSGNGTVGAYGPDAVERRVTAPGSPTPLDRGPDAGSPTERTAADPLSTSEHADGAAQPPSSPDRTPATTPRPQPSDARTSEPAGPPDAGPAPAPTRQPGVPRDAPATTERTVPREPATAREPSTAREPDTPAPPRTREPAADTAPPRTREPAADTAPPRTREPPADTAPPRTREPAADPAPPRTREPAADPAPPDRREPPAQRNAAPNPEPVTTPEGDLDPESGA